MAFSYQISAISFILVISAALRRRVVSGQ